ncbi:MAG: hypothetical protein PSV35_05330, partial [bacterium]|nr:hypothetical protein [bacterium]
QLPKQLYKAEPLKWEARFFWSDNTIIHLGMIDDALFNLANYQQKSKIDYYYILPDNNYNIKRRRNELLYKPLVSESTKASCFGPKLSLEQLDTQADPVLKKRLIQLGHEVQRKALEVCVSKESFTYKFATRPAIKLELARLEVNKKIYFSACIEGKSLYLVESISKHLLGEGISCDYVSFLKKIIS